MNRQHHIDLEETTVIALNALEFLAQDQARLERFMALTGVDLAAIRASAEEPGFLAAILDHLRHDQSLLMQFAESFNLTPAAIDRARARLPGGHADF
jgi:hypothetical protein